MKLLKSRVLVASLATTLAAGSLACSSDILDQVDDVLNAVQILGKFSERLEKGRTLTYTAEYTVAGSTSTVTVAQKPPSSAFAAADGRYIFTPESIYLCSTQQGALTCQKSANDGGDLGTGSSGAIQSVAGPGFVPAELALSLILAASAVPGATVSESSKTIAGQPSLCAPVSGLEAGAEAGSTDAPKDFSVCVTESGVLAEFIGTSTSNEAQGVTLVSFTDSADDAMFAPPAGATIVDVNQVQPA